MQHSTWSIIMFILFNLPVIKQTRIVLYSSSIVARTLSPWISPWSSTRWHMKKSYGHWMFVCKQKSLLAIVLFIQTLRLEHFMWIDEFDLLINRSLEITNSNNS